MRRIFLIAAVALASGCFRLTDPVYMFRSLGAEEPESPANSLLFGTLEITGPFSRIDSILLKRVSPWRDDEYFVGATERRIYRIIRPRLMKDGHFLIQVPPGVYQVEALQGGMWGKDAAFMADDGARAASRMVVSRPGIYDLGRLRLDAGAFSGSAKLSWEGRGGEDRERVLRDAVAGTQWERYLGEKG